MENTLFILDKINNLSNIPMTFFPFGNHSAFRTFSRNPLDFLPYSCDPALSEEKLKPCVYSGMPILTYENDIITYAALQDTEGNGIILGPVCTYSPVETLHKHYREIHHIEEKKYKIPSTEFSILGSNISLLYFFLYGKQISEHDLILFDTNADFQPHQYNPAYQAHMMYNSDHEKNHHSYLDEQTIMGQIATGDVESIRKRTMHITISDLQSLDERVGTMAHQPLKNYEYIVCSSITLATRYAIQGGLDPQTAYGISDMFMQKLSNCRTMNSMLKLHVKMMITFAESVHNSKLIRSKQSLTAQIQAYINEHITQRFVLDDLAAALGISKAHMCRQFHNETGNTILHYLQQRRIETAENLLLYSSQDISAIASQLCFNSQSHFGTVFKKFTGTSPYRYRNGLQPPCDTIYNHLCL